MDGLYFIFGWSLAFNSALPSLLYNNLNIIRLSLQTANTSSYYLSNVNEYEEIAKIDNLPAGIYIASGRVQRNVHESVTDVTSWVSVDGGGSPNTSYGPATTIPGGTQYPIASIVRFITLSQSGSIRLYVRSNNKDAGFGGVLQILRIA